MRRIRAFLAVVVLTVASVLAVPVAAHADSGCTRLWVTSTNYADVCKGRWSVGGGYYDGWVRVDSAVGAGTEIRLDNQQHYFTDPGDTRFEAFYSFKRVVIRAWAVRSPILYSAWW